MDSAVGLGAVDEKLFVARSRCLTSLERQAITINCQSWTAGTVLTILVSVSWTLSVIIKIFIETVLSTLRPVEAMEDADKALAQNKLSTKAIIAKVSLRFFFKFMIYMTYFWRRRRSYNVWQLFVK